MVAEAGFGCGVGVAFGVADFVFVVFDFFDESCFGEVFGYLFADGEAVHADVHSGGFADGGVVIEDVDCLQVVFFAEHVVVHVMGGCDFEAACAEVDLYVVVFDDGDFTAYEGYDDAFAAEVLVFGVVGVDAHCGVAHDGFRACGGHDGIAFFADDFVAEVVEF